MNGLPEQGPDRIRGISSKRPATTVLKPVLQQPPGPGR